MAEAKDILLALGFSEAEISKEDLDVDATVDSFREKQKALFLNDKDFVEPIRAAERAKTQGTIEAKVKRILEISPEDIKDAKTIEQMLEAGKEKISKKSTTGNEDLQQQLVEANRKIQQYEEEVIPATEAKAAEEVKQYKIKDKLTKKVAALSLSIDTEAALILLESHLSSSNKLDLDEKGDLIILDKDGNKVMDDKKVKIFSTDEILDATASRFKIKKESHAGETATKTATATNTNTANTGANTYTNPNKSTDAQKWLDERKAQRESQAA